MSARQISYLLAIFASLTLILISWDTILRSKVPYAVEAAQSRGERIPAYQTIGVDAASHTTAWLVWAAVAAVAVWKFEKRKKESGLWLLGILAIYLLPMCVVSALLTFPLLG